MPAIAVASDGANPDEWPRRYAVASGLDFFPVLPAPSAADLSLLPRALALEFAAAPVSLASDDDWQFEEEFCVALAAPHDFHAIDSLRYLLRREIRFVVAPAAEIQRIITTFYAPGA